MVRAIQIPIPSKETNTIILFLSGHQIIIEMFIAKCVKCVKMFDVSTWKERLWKRRAGIRKLLIIEDPNEIQLLPTIRRNCRRCEKGTIHYTWSRQLRSADESETTFYRCNICGSVSRESL